MCTHSPQYAPPVAAIYARFSSSEQRTESITAQVRACQEYAQKRGYVVSKIYSDEAVSGKGSQTKKRLQYQKMLKDASARKFEILLIHKYDRAARNVQEHVNLASKLSAADIEIIAVAQDFGNSKEAKITKVLTWAMSEFYVDNLSDETRKGLQENALLGLHNGGVAPFGYNVLDKRYVVNPLEAAYVKRMFEACLNGHKYNDILAELSAAGIKGKRGRPMTYSSIYEILRNEKYTGIYTYTLNQSSKRDARRAKENAVRIDGAIPAIIDKLTWEKVQKIMKGRKNNGRSPKHVYLLSGRIFCSCGAPMHGTTTRRIKAGREYEYSYYLCSAKCGAKCVKVDEIEPTVFNYLKSLLTEENRLTLNNSLEKYRRVMAGAVSVDTSYTKHEIAERENQIDALMMNMRSAVLPSSVLEQMGVEIEQLQQQIAMLKLELERPLTFSESAITNYFSTITDLEHQTPEIKLHTIQRLIERVDITKNSVNVTSTFTEFLGSIGCGGRI